MKTVKTVLVTGAEGSLGSTVSARFAREGVRVAGTCFGNPGTAALELWQKADLSNASSVHVAVGAVREKLGSIDALVHCAGGFRYGSVDQLSEGDIEFLFNSNLKSTVWLLREVIPLMKKQGFGRIVLISSKATLAPGAGVGVYAATKAGINALVQSCAEELKSFDITINAVAPTIIDTPANRRDMGEAGAGAWIKQEQLAEIIFNLTAELGAPIHGALIPVAGRV